MSIKSKRVCPQFAYEKVDSKGTTTSDEKDDNFLVFVVRLGVLAYMIAVTVVFGWSTYYLLSENESELRLTEYEGVAGDLGRSVQEATHRNFHASHMMAEFAGLVCPDAAQWPNCSFMSLAQYAHHSSILGRLSPSLNFLSVLPILTPDQIPGFEAFAYDFYADQGHGENDTQPYGISPVLGEKGIFSIDENGTTVRSTDCFDGGENCFVIPVMYSTTLSGVLMFNIYFEEARMKAVDNMVRCVNGSTATELYTDSCGAVTDILDGPSTSYFSPIFPDNDNTTLVGQTSGFFRWADILDGHLAPNGRSVMAVVESGTTSYTYEVYDSHVSIIGEGDSHDSKYNKHAKEFTLLEERFSDVAYKLTIYPSSGLGTPSGFPIAGAFIASFVIVVTALVVLVYDQVVSRYARERQIIGETKRLFVRYVSHEIRTPLNTVHLGLVYLKSNIERVLEVVKDAISPDAVAEIKSWVGLVEEVEESGNIAVTVLNDLINYDKIVMGSLNLEISELYIFRCVQNTVRSFLLQAKERNISVQFLCENV